MKCICASTILIATASLYLVSRLPAMADNQKKMQRVSVDEIGRTVQLVGRLGVPLGDAVEINGYWHFPSQRHEKDDSIRFTVTVVDGKTLNVPVEFNHGQVAFSDASHQSVIPEFGKHSELESQVWTLIAYAPPRRVTRLMSTAGGG
jgi:hypothetical protein